MTAWKGQMPQQAGRQQGMRGRLCSRRRTAMCGREPSLPHASEAAQWALTSSRQNSPVWYYLLLSPNAASSSAVASSGMAPVCQLSVSIYIPHCISLAVFLLKYSNLECLFSSARSGGAFGEQSGSGAMAAQVAGPPMAPGKSAVWPHTPYRYVPPGGASCNDPCYSCLTCCLYLILSWLCNAV